MHIESAGADGFVRLIEKLLAVHDYRVERALDPAEIFPVVASANEDVTLSTGVLYNTFEWVHQLGTEWGIGKGSDFRIEAMPEFAQGAVAVCIHGSPTSYPNRRSLEAFAEGLMERNIRKFLVFANTDDIRYFGSFFGVLRGTGIQCMPQLIGDIGYNLLTATSVYLEYRESVSWGITNYLWKNADEN